MLTVFRIVFAVLCLGKAVDIATRGAEVLGLPVSLTLGTLWAAASVALGFGYRIKLASGLIIALAVAVTGLSRLEMYNQHLYLIASVCLIFILGRSVPTLLRAQLSIAYGFAAITKLNDSFLSGTVVYVSAVQRPVWENIVQVEPTPAFLIAISVAAICVEAFLAAAFWHHRLRWVALVVGLGFHLGMLVLMSEDLASLLRLSIFGFLMISLYIPFFAPEIDRLRARGKVDPNRLVPVQV